MSVRDFNMVSPTVWRSGRFASLSVRAKLLLLYVLTSEHQTSAGCYRLPPGYAVEDIKCTAEEFNEDMAALVTAGLAFYDAATKEVFPIGWFSHCPPTNLKHAKGAQKIISKISSDTVREHVEAEFANTEWGGKTKVDASAEVHPFDRPNNRLINTSYLRGRENL